MEETKKRKLETEGSDRKRPKPWRVPKKGQGNYAAPSIEPGDAGIWATCDMGKEGKCTAELRDLFEEYAAKLYGTSEDQIDAENSDDEAEVDIEAEIKKEVQGMKSKTTTKGILFQPVKVDIQCVLFFKTRKPVEPVDFVHRICQDAVVGATKKHRWVKRLTPMTMMGKATVEGLGKVAQTVLQPVFHGDESPSRKFAIRPTRRNHNVMKRDEIIRQIASAVGPRHSVDLKHYDYLILVDVYRGVLGMSVVGNDFEGLKQFNLAEIYNPSQPMTKPEAETIKKGGNTEEAEESHDAIPNRGKTGESQAADAGSPDIPNTVLGDSETRRPLATTSTSSLS